MIKSGGTSVPPTAPARSPTRPPNEIMLIGVAGAFAADRGPHIGQAGRAERRDRALRPLPLILLPGINSPHHGHPNELADPTENQTECRIHRNGDERGEADHP
jgi:hypothetical protein